jgi:hypothetical protein
MPTQTLSRSTRIAEALANVIRQSAYFGDPNVVRRAYTVADMLGDLVGFVVDVLPAAITIDQEDRGDEVELHTIDLLIRKAVVATPQSEQEVSEVDDCLAACDELVDFVRSNAIEVDGEASGGVEFFGVQRPVLYDHRALSDDRIFAGVVEVTYRTVQAKQ